MATSANYTKAVIGAARRFRPRFPGTLDHIRLLRSITTTMRAHIQLMTWVFCDALTSPPLAPFRMLAQAVILSASQEPFNPLT